MLRKGKRKSRIRYALCIVLFVMMVHMMGNTVRAAGADSPKVKSESTAVKKKTGKIITKKGRKYYQYANGKKAKNKFIEIKGKTYFFAKNGAMEKGWMKRGSSYYYFDRSTGVQKSGCKVDGVKIGKDGKAKKTDYSKKKIATMIKAKSIMNKVTRPTDSKKQKLRKVFDWVKKHPYRRYRVLPKSRKKGWETAFANDVYNKGDGCCVSAACAFAFLAHECGYKDVYVCDDTGHAWTEINGRVYDTLFARVKSFTRYYNASYSTAHLWCVNKLKI